MAITDTLESVHKIGETRSQRTGRFHSNCSSKSVTTRLIYFTVYVSTYCVSGPYSIFCERFTIKGRKSLMDKS